MLQIHEIYMIGKFICFLIILKEIKIKIKVHFIQRDIT